MISGNGLVVMDQCLIGLVLMDQCKWISVNGLVANGLAFNGLVASKVPVNWNTNYPNYTIDLKI